MPNARSIAKTAFRAFQAGSRKFGVEIFLNYERQPRWSYTVDDYYPVDEVQRWGHDGKAPHPQINALFSRAIPDINEALDQVCAVQAVFDSVPMHALANTPSPYLSNTWFYGLDAAALIGMIAWKKPKRYFEIGSGNSTKFARHAINTLGLDTKITSLDPSPRAEIDSLCDHQIRQPLETCDLSQFQELEPGDILFYDGSHRVFMNSDVTVFFLDVLPRIKPGVLVHIHDIFLPFDYPKEHQGRLYSEQYLLAVMLLCGSPPLKLVLPNYFVSRNKELNAKVRHFLASTELKLMGSFWGIKA
jgi:hypothetical protein